MIDYETVPRKTFNDHFYTEYEYERDIKYVKRIQNPWLGLVFNLQDILE